jgi:hypothetical protein
MNEVNLFNREHPNEYPWANICWRTGSIEEIYFLCHRASAWAADGYGLRRVRPKQKWNWQWKGKAESGRGGKTHFSSTGMYEHRGVLKRPAFCKHSVHFATKNEATVVFEANTGAGSTYIETGPNIDLSCAICRWRTKIFSEKSILKNEKAVQKNGETVQKNEALPPEIREKMCISASKMQNGS